MGTKANPGQFDCYGKAASDEPIFTLRAKDPIAPSLVRAWRYLRAGRLAEAMTNLIQGAEAWRIQTACGLRTDLPLDSDKSVEAEVCAEAMETWLKAKE